MWHWLSASVQWLWKRKIKGEHVEPPPRPPVKKKPPVNYDSESMDDMSWVSLSSCSEAPEADSEDLPQHSHSTTTLLRLRNRLKRTGFLRKFFQLSRLRYSRNLDLQRRRLFEKYLPVQFDKTILGRPKISLLDSAFFWECLVIDLGDSFMDIKDAWPAPSNRNKNSRIRLQFQTMSDEHIWCAALVYLFFEADTYNAYVSFNTRTRQFSTAPPSPESSIESSSSDHMIPPPPVLFDEPSESPLPWNNPEDPVSIPLETTPSV